MGTLLQLGSVYCPWQNWFPHSLTLPLCAYYPPWPPGPYPQFIGHAGGYYSLIKWTCYLCHTHSHAYTVVPGCTAVSEAGHCQIVEQCDSQSWGSTPFFNFFFLGGSVCQPPFLAFKSRSYGKICKLGISPLAHLLAMDTPEHELPPTVCRASVKVFRLWRIPSMAKVKLNKPTLFPTLYSIWSLGRGATWNL